MRDKHTLCWPLLALSLSLSLTSCSSAPKPQPPKPIIAASSYTEALDALPPLGELAMIEAEPEVTRLGEDGGVTALRVGELLVLHKPTPANQVVSAQLYIQGGARHMTAKTAGAERMALEVAVSGGTTKTPKDEFNAKLDAVGASVGSFADRDASAYSMKSVLPHFELTWSLFEEAILTPALPQEEVELARDRQLAQIDSLLQDPDSQVTYTASQVLFEGHPYANIQLGSRESVEALTREGLAGYQRWMLNPADMILVVVGDVPQDKLIAHVKGGLGKLKSTRPGSPPLPEVPKRGGLAHVPRPELPTHYIFGMFPAPAPDHPDFAPMFVGMDYLSDRLFEEVRTKRNLTYAVSAGLANRLSNTGYLYVTAANPGETMPVIEAEIAALKREPLSEDAIKQTVNVFITQHFMSQETNASQAAFLANAHITTGDWRNANRLLEQLRAVKAQDIQRVMNTYLKGYQFAVVGGEEGALDLAVFGVKPAPTPTSKPNQN